MKIPLQAYTNSTLETYVYQTSAYAAFAALSMGIHAVSIAQYHNFGFSFVSELFRYAYNPMRKKIGLDPIKTITTIHGWNREHGVTSHGSWWTPSLYHRLGMRSLQPHVQQINMTAIGMLSSSAILTVSSGVKKQMLDDIGGFGLAHIFRFKESVHRFFGIQNGVDVSTYDPKLINNVGEFSLNDALDHAYENKMKAKSFLSEKKLINHPTKPLWTFIGRFSREKGVSYLIPAAVRIMAEGGQLVVMGVLEENPSREIVTEIEQLKAFERDGLSIKVYTNIKEDQIQKIKDTEIRKGTLIRFASDFILAPSIEETASIVALEGKVMGSLLFSSGVQGLADVTDPFTGRNFDSFNGFRFKMEHPYDFDNAVDYRNNPKTTADLEAQIHYANSSWHEFPTAVKNDVIRRIIREGYEFDWKNQFKKYQTMYEKMKDFDEAEMVGFEREYHLSEGFLKD